MHRLNDWDLHSPWVLQPLGLSATQGISGQAEPLWPTPTIGSVVSGPTGTTAAQGLFSWLENLSGMTLTAADRSSAQMVPDQPQLSLFGRLNSADPSKVYAIPGAPGMRVGAIELLLASAGNIPLEMTVYDASGQQVADLALIPGSGPPVLSTSVPVDSSSQSPGVYVKIAASSGLGGSHRLLRDGLGQL